MPALLALQPPTVRLAVRCWEGGGGGGQQHWTPFPNCPPGWGAGGGKKETKLGLTAKKDGDFGEWYSQVCVSGG